MFKNENGFSLVELAIAAGLAVALAATAVTILSGTTASLSSKANGAAGTSSQYNTDVLNETGASAGSNNGGNTAGAGYTAADLIVGASNNGMSPASWSSDAPILRVSGSWYSYTGAHFTMGAGDTPTWDGYKTAFLADGATVNGNVIATSMGETITLADPYTITIDTPAWMGADTTTLHKVDASGNIVAW